MLYDDDNKSETAPRVYLGQNSGWTSHLGQSVRRIELNEIWRKMGLLDVIQECKDDHKGTVTDIISTRTDIPIDPPPTVEINTNALIPTDAMTTDISPSAYRVNNHYSRRIVHKFYLRKTDMSHCTREAVWRAIQGDTGANCTATNDRTILWQFQVLRQPIPIATYNADTANEQTCYATGMGIIKLISDDNSILECRALYCPTATGTILSPHRIMMDKNGIEEFNHRGMKNGSGKIEFRDKEGRYIAGITMTSKRDGIYMASNQILIPKENSTCGMAIETEEDELRLHHHKMSEDTTPPPLTEEWNINQATAPTISDAKRLSQNLYNMELWHQRMGHVGWRTLQKTREMVDGIPTLPLQDSGFHCPYCDASKQTKKSGNKTAKRETFEPGTAFHMDLGFVSGPSNLEDVLHKGSTPKMTTQKSYDGHVAYLLIVDAATRYSWVFLLKDKRPPLRIIEAFLETNGCAKQYRKCQEISTSPIGTLARSQEFKIACAKYGFKIKQRHYDHGLDHPVFTVTTDNGTELSGSEEFRSVVFEQGYLPQTTAPDGSSQSGKGERPHRTLKERTRCMLYTAGLGTEFWSDAILHANWLQNRTYHSAIEDTPYRAWTGRKPTLDGLLTFGCKITSKKTGKRPSTNDPHVYDGIFLGYRATMDNIVFWNTKSKQKMTTRHYTVDELEYGRHPEDRSPASKFLLEKKTGTAHEERRSDILHDQTVQLDPDKVLILGDETTAAAATFRVNSIKRPTTAELHRQLRLLDFSTDLFGPAIIEEIPLHTAHTTLGLIVRPHPDLNNTVLFERCKPGTMAHKNIRRWRSRLKGALVKSVGGYSIQTPQDIQRILAEHRRKKATTIAIEFSLPQWSGTNGEGLPMLHFDQLNVIAHHLHAIETGEDLWKDKTRWPDITDEMLDSCIQKGIAVPKLTRRKLKLQEDWLDFQRSEWSQLDKYEKQGMFGEPCTRPQGVTTLPWVWTYLYKPDPITFEPKAKARGTCNGGPRYGKVVTLAETFAACLEQPAHRLAWALTAACNHIALGCDVANAFAEADAPEEPFYMEVDDQFNTWWTQHLGKPPIPQGYVIPILKNLQGHPEAPRLWSKHIDDIIQNKLHFASTTHEPCLYHKRVTSPDTTAQDDADTLIFVLRQVDDFMISAPTKIAADQVRQHIQQHMTNTLNDLGVIQRFNGVDIRQTKHYVKLHCESYIDKIVSHHGWMQDKAANNPIPMRTDTAYQSELETTEGPTDPTEQKALEDSMGFSYRQAIGELIFALTICRLDISAAVIKLSQYSEAPARCHYQAVRHVFAYLHATKTEGIYYWRPEPHDALPDEPLPTHTTIETILAQFKQAPDALSLLGASDSTWGNDRKHRRSTSGIVFMLAGGAIYYRTRIQPTIALSSTEAELAAMADAGKAALYLRSILEELGIEQTEPTPISVDNRGARQFTNAQQPTRRTRHIEMKELVIQQWTDEEQITFDEVSTQFNPSDSLSKALGRVKFYEQNDILMGRRRPQFTTTKTTVNTLHFKNPREYMI